MIKASYYVNAIRSMGLQAIMRAKSGHPGMVMSAAPITYAAYIEGINISQENPHWINRDRFVLSAGHGSMSVYPILHFARLIELEKIQNFRQKIDAMPGHPENIISPYIEATTGPLGQGIANAVGMAIAESYLSNQYNDLPRLIDHYTIAVVGDGDLQEGICYESMSIAGKLALNKLIVLHDSNNYQLESEVSLVNSENIELRVKSMGWNYISCTNDPYKIINAIKSAKSNKNSPTFIEIKTIIGESLSFSNSYKAHGGSVTEEEIKKFNNYFNCNFNDWNFDSNVYYHFVKNVVEKGNNKYHSWIELLEKYKQEKPQRVKKFLKQINNEFIDIKSIINFDEKPKDKATRVVAGWVLQQIEKAKIDDIVVMSPDISKSTNISINNTYFNDDKKSNMIMVGIREFGMAAIQNGIELHGGLRSISSLFLAFSDYLKSAIRLASISHISPTIVFTHDSLCVGADGPTHQPVEQIGMLRSIPRNVVYRPCDENETIGAFIDALSKKNDYPINIVLSRQNLKSNINTCFEKTINFGGYEIFNNSDKPDITLCASGSEVELSMQVSELLLNKYNITSKVISVPNLNKFLNNKDVLEIINSKLGLVSIEASNDSNWYKLGILAKKYCNVSVTNFGYSIDGDLNYQYSGMNKKNIVYKIISTFKSNETDLIKKAKDMLENKNKEFQDLKESAV